MTPETFAPSIITTDEEEGSSGFARNGTVFLFQKFLERRCHTYIMRLRDGVWTAPELIPFWEAMAANGDFVFSSDDKTMLYQVRTGVGPSTISHVWRAEVTETGWGEQTPLPEPSTLPTSRASPPTRPTGHLLGQGRIPGPVQEVAPRPGLGEVEDARKRLAGLKNY